MIDGTADNEIAFDYNLLAYGPTAGRTDYVARINWEFLDAVSKVGDVETLRDYDVRVDPLNLLAGIETPRILIPGEVDEQGNVIYEKSVPITQARMLVPRFFDSDFFCNSFRHSFEEMPIKQDYTDSAIFKKSSSLIEEGKEGLRATILRREEFAEEGKRALHGTRYSQSTNSLASDGLYDEPLMEYLIPVEERERQIKAFSALGQRYLQEML